jgi:hypothetical protein
MSERLAAALAAYQAADEAHASHEDAMAAALDAADRIHPRNGPYEALRVAVPPGSYSAALAVLENLGPLLRDTRRWHGYSARRVAADVGMSGAWVTLVETRKRAPYRGRLLTILRWLHEQTAGDTQAGVAAAIDVLERFQPLLDAALARWGGSVSAAAEEMGVGRPNLIALRTGHRDGSLDVILRVLRWMNVQPGAVAA